MNPDIPAGATPGPEPCRSCRAPLVPGQRYCLYCGTRVGDARLEFLDVLAADVRASGGVPAVAPAAVAAPSAPEPGVNGWLRAHSPLLGLTGLLLATLLIGLLIGHWATGGDGGSSQAAAPQVIRVSGGATTTASDSGAADAAAGGDAAGASSSAKKKAAAKKAAAAETTAAPKGAVSVDKLNNLSGKAKDKAIEQAAKKGQPISTGNGKVTPKDDKAPGGGSDFETIG